MASYRLRRPSYALSNYGKKINLKNPDVKLAVLTGIRYLLLNLKLL